MPRPKSDIDERIVHAARERFLLEGVDGASLRDIAKDAKTSVGMIHYWFPTKDDLFMEVVEEVYEKLLADVAVALAPDTDVETRVRRLFRRLAIMSDEEYTMIRLVLREALVSGTRLQRLAKRFLEGHIPLAIGLLVEGVQNGQITDRVPPAGIVAALASLAIFPNLMRRRVGAVMPSGLVLPSEEEAGDVLADLLFHGIAGKKQTNKTARNKMKRRKA